ncbi:SDR family NAD(P)-dependent oxidoreductase [Ravibacter arvi]|uniref:SDR family NAD(P)-dependent oxidoreductase n=1 Tax=Ravibacter arvi TaxID=2051041 RepID=A0ABP8LUD1_9BACT
MSEEFYKGKVVWVTGASAGIGEALVKAFASAGARVVLTARRRDELERVRLEAGLSEDRSLVLPADVTDFEAAPVLFSNVLAKFGQIDIVVHNAGVSQRSYIHQTDFTVYQKLMDVNFYSTVAITKAVLPFMINHQAGQFIVISSVAGKIGTIMRSGYCASKHALHGFFDSLRAEYFNERIKVTTICPGYIRTNVSLNAMNESGGKYGKMDANQEQGISPEVCADKILKAVRKGRKEVYIGGLKEVAAIYLKRFFPAILFDQVRKNIPD